MNKTRGYRTFVIAGLLLGGGAAYLAWQASLLGSAYAAKLLCSEVFVTGQAPAQALALDLPAPLRRLDTDVDLPGRAVRAGLWGAAQREAVYAPGLGCTLAIGITTDALRARAQPVRAPDTARSQPPGEPRQTRSEDVRLRALLEKSFAEPEGAASRGTRAIVIVHHGEVVAEGYAPGFSEHSALPGWSMSKSVVNALVGVLVAEGRLALDDRPRFTPWRADDPRAAITLDHLLRMSSGLEVTEGRRGALDVLRMLLGAHDVARFALERPLVAPPGSRWHYDNGTSNIISRMMRDALGDDAQYLAFPRRALFGPLGMDSAVIEPDPSGTFVGSSFLHATARDWARFGELYLNDGVWDGRRLLPPGWVEYSRTPAPAAPAQEYGAHFWLRIPPRYRGDDSPALPGDAFHAIGREGQFLTIVPSHRTVIVRMGLTRGRDASWDHQGFVADVLAVLGGR